MPFPEWLIVRRAASLNPGHDVKLLFTFKQKEIQLFISWRDEELFFKKILSNLDGPGSIHVNQVLPLFQEYHFFQRNIYKNQLLRINGISIGRKKR